MLDAKYSKIQMVITQSILVGFGWFKDQKYAPAPSGASQSDKTIAEGPAPAQQPVFTLFDESETQQ